MQVSQNESMADCSENEIMEKIDITHQRFPYCIVWTPIPLLTWMVRIIKNVLFLEAGWGLRVNPIKS